MYVDRSIEVRIAGAAGALFIPGLWLWTLRDQWRIAAVALLVVGLVGLMGGGLYWLVVERRRGATGLTGWFVASAVSIALAVGSAARITGDWRGWHTVLGAVASGATVACWLVFIRMALRGLPRPDDSAGG